MFNACRRLKRSCQHLDLDFPHFSSTCPICPLFCQLFARRNIWFLSIPQKGFFPGGLHGKNNVEQSQKYANECLLCGRFVSDNTKEYQTSSKTQPWTQIHRDNRVLHWSFLLLLFVTWRHNPHSLFLSVSEEANADGDLWMLPTVGKILTSIH